MKNNLKVGIIGLGNRGYELLNKIILHMDKIDVVAVCDYNIEVAKKANDRIKEVKGSGIFVSTNYKELLTHEEVEAVVIASSWTEHISMAIACMKAGKAVGVEVGGACSIEECWQLIRTYEETSVPCMMLANCCYGRDEMMIQNMVEKDVYGRIIHCACGYKHDLRKYLVEGLKNKNYRSQNYVYRNCENYPFHGIGPISKILDINRGNQMLTLVSVSSKSNGLQEYISRINEIEDVSDNIQFAQGDIVTTIIKCARGETIVLTLDTTLPGPYSRGLRVQGTKGMYMNENNSIFIDGIHNEYEFNWKQEWNNIEKYRNDYEHPLWKKVLNNQAENEYIDMDWLVLNDFFHCVKYHIHMPIDVYDMALWMAITNLSEQSIALGGQMVNIPDFTNGKWVSR